MSNINGRRQYYVDDKTGTADEILSFYPESYLDNKNHPEYYTQLNTEEIICDFIIKEKLGEGAFGSVRLGINKQTGEKVAIKIYEKSKLNRYQDKKRLEREIEILKKLKHPNIVQLYSVIETERQILLIMEYIKGQELFQYILIKKKLSEDEACFYFQQIISGIEYLHNLKIVHRDIKSENILIEQNTNIIKIIDFGFSNIYGDKDKEILNTACGSPFYAPPEMLRGESYKGGGVDIWSVGVVLFAMICGYLPFEGEENSELYKKIIDGKFSIPSYISIHGRELLYQLLNTNPKKRINIMQIKRHPWVKFYSNGLYNNGEPIFNVGLNIDKYIIPIDEEIVEQMEKKFNLSKIKIRIDILSNKCNDCTTLYYLILHQKIRSGKKSISDLKSDLFLDYIKNKKNLLFKYNHNLKDAINKKKMGEININNNKIEKSGNNLHLSKINNNNNYLGTQNIKTPNYKSNLDLKININNTQMSDKKAEQYKRNHFAIIKKSIMSSSPLKKTKSKIKFHNINHLKKKNILDINTSKNINNKNKKEINKKISKIQSVTLSPNDIKKQKLKISKKENKIENESDENKDSERSIENKINKTEIILSNYKTKLNKEDIKKENKTIILREDILGKKESKNNKSEKKKYKGFDENSNYIKNKKNKNIFIKIEEKFDNFNIENSENYTNGNTAIKNQNISNYNETQKIKVNNLITDEKIKYAQTLDSFSIPTINQDELISSNNYTFQKIVEASFTPKKENKNKNIINSAKMILNDEYIKSKKKVNANLFKISKKKNTTTNYNDKINMIKYKNKKIINNSINKKRNVITNKKIITNKKNENYKTHNLKNDYIKIININNNYNLKIENTYVLTSFNPLDDINDNKIITTENNSNIKINRKQNKYKDEKFNSIETGVNGIQNIDSNRFNNNNDNNENLKRIKTININDNKSNKKYKMNINKISSPTISYYKKNNLKLLPKQIDNNKKKDFLNKNTNSGFLFNRNNQFHKNKILSEVFSSPICNTSNKNMDFNIGNINIKNNQVNNQFLNNLKEYFSYDNKNINNINKNNEIYEPFDLNCIFALPRKNLKEKLINIFEKMNYKVIRINQYKYNILFGEKKDIFEFCFNINNKRIVKIKKLKGNNNKYINNIRKIIYSINK